MDKDVYRAATPFIVLMKIFGLFPLEAFTIQVNKKNLLFRIKNFMFVVFSYLLLFGVIFVNLIRDRVEIEYSKVQPKAWEYTLSFGLLSLLITLFYQHSQIQSIIKFSNLLRDFDKKVNIL